MEKLKKEEAVLQNNAYILKLIHKASPGKIPFYLLVVVLKVATNFLFNVFLIRLVVNNMQSGGDFYEIVRYIVIFGIVLVIYYILDNYFNEIYAPISDKTIYKNIQKQVFAKAAEVDLSCYENNEFYDTYMKAVNETHRISQAVLNSVGDMSNNVLTIFSVSLMIFMIEPVFIKSGVRPLGNRLA